MHYSIESYWYFDIDISGIDLFLWYLQCLWTLIPGHLSSHSALSSYGLFCVAHSLATLCLSTSGPDPRELPGFWGSVVFCHAPIPWVWSGKQQQSDDMLVLNFFSYLEDSLIILRICFVWIVIGNELDNNS